MIDELHKLFESAAHLRDLPQYKNLSKWVNDRIQELEDKLAAKDKPKAIPSEPEEEVERRI